MTKSSNWPWLDCFRFASLRSSLQPVSVLARWFFHMFWARCSIWDCMYFSHLDAVTADTILEPSSGSFCSSACVEESQAAVRQQIVENRSTIALSGCASRLRSSAEIFCSFFFRFHLFLPEQKASINHNLDTPGAASRVTAEYSSYV